MDSGSSTDGCSSAGPARNQDSVQESARYRPLPELRILDVTASDAPVVTIADPDGFVGKFSTYQMEMIVTNDGRRMFPRAGIHLHNLEPTRHYDIVAHFVASDDQQYRYKGGCDGWRSIGKAEDDCEPVGCYYHPQSGSTGEELNKLHAKRNAIAFEKLKIANKTARQDRGYISLKSMRKYQLRVYIVRRSPTLEDEAWCYDFPETNFIAVTSYGDERVKSLKVKYNAFSKGHRQKSGLSPDFSESLPAFTFPNVSNDIQTSRATMQPVTSQSNLTLAAPLRGHWVAGQAPTFQQMPLMAANPAQVQTVCQAPMISVVPAKRSHDSSDADDSDHEPSSQRLFITAARNDYRHVDQVTPSASPAPSSVGREVPCRPQVPALTPSPSLQATIPSPVATAPQTTFAPLQLAQPMVPVHTVQPVAAPMQPHLIQPQFMTATGALIGQPTQPVYQLCRQPGYQPVYQPQPFVRLYIGQC